MPCLSEGDEFSITVDKNVKSKWKWKWIQEVDVEEYHFDIGVKSLMSQGLRFVSDPSSRNLV